MYDVACPGPGPIAWEARGLVGVIHAVEPAQRPHGRLAVHRDPEKLTRLRGAPQVGSKAHPRPVGSKVVPYLDGVAAGKPANWDDHPCVVSDAGRVSILEDMPAT